jgi:hypothetical protein
MTQDESKAVQLAIANLVSTLEDALLRLQAFQDAARAHYPALLLVAEQHQEDLKSSSLERKYTALRIQAIQAVQDQDWPALAETTGDLSGLAHQFLNQGRAL